jgi:hypothetical protein
LNNTTGRNNSAFGEEALRFNTTGSYNTAYGSYALYSNTTASDNTAVGYQAGYLLTGERSVFVGRQAGQAMTTGSFNTIVGDQAGYNATTGTFNTFIGQGSGEAITTGSKNSILGKYNGNSGGLDIRTADNYIVLSDGDGNPRAFINNSGQVFFDTVTATATAGGTCILGPSSTGGPRIVTGHATGTAGGNAYAQYMLAGTEIGSVTQNGTTGVLYNITSDYRLKNEQQPLTGAKEFIMALQPKKWQWWDGSGEGVGFIAHEFMEVAKYSGQSKKDAVDADGKPVYQSIQPSSSEVMANLVAHIQNLEARLAALESN